MKTLGRYEKDGNRFYYDDKQIYISATTLLKNTLPTPDQLIRWTADIGYKEAKRFMYERATYGTLMHMIFQELLEKKQIQLGEKLMTRIRIYAQENGISTNYVHQWTEEMTKDILSFIQFCQDYEVSPVMIEVPLASQKLGVAGAIDLVATLTIPTLGDHGEKYKSGVKKGEVKLTKAPIKFRSIIDFKSGKKGFHESYPLQLTIYKDIWDENFPDMPVQKIFNYAGKAWREHPTYSLKEQDYSPDVIPNLVAISKRDKPMEDREIITFKEQVVTLKTDTNKLFTIKTINDEIRGK